MKTQSMRKPRISSLVAGLALPFLFHPAAHAVELAASVAYTGEYSSNATRTEDNQQSDFIQRPTFSFSAGETSRSLELSASYRVLRRIHREDFYQDKNVVRGQGSVSWGVLNDRIRFDAQNLRVETAIDNTAQDTEDNREVVDRTSAGVNVQVLRFGRQHLDVEARVESINTNTTDSDSEREFLTVSHNMPLGDRGSLRFFGTEQVTDYDQAGASNYRIRDTGVSVARDSDRFSFSGQVGRSRAELEDSDISVSANTWAAAVSYTLNRTNSFSVTMSRDLSDNELEDVSLQDEADGLRDFDRVVVAESALNELFIINSAGANWNSQIGRSTFDLSLGRTDLEYEESSRSEYRNTLRLAVSRSLSRKLNARLQARYSEFEFEDRDQSDEESDIRIALDYKMTRDLGLGFTVSLFDRKSDDPINGHVDGVSYLFSVRYALLSP